MSRNACCGSLRDRRNSCLLLRIQDWRLGFHLRTVLQGATWNDGVVDVIALGERVARSWILGGDVSGDPEGWSNKTRVAGAISIQWLLLRDTRFKNGR